MPLEILEYDIALVALGLIVLGAVAVPKALSDQVISYPLAFVAAGVLLFALPLGLEPVHPLEEPDVTEHLTELGVIIALTALGLKIDRPFGWPGWRSTARLLAITMPLTIAAAAVLGWWIIGLAVPTAMLLGAVIAPTDPVLAAQVQTGDPLTQETAEPDEDVDDIDPRTAEDEVRFALSSEAALNDGLAFPFTNAAILMAMMGSSPDKWIGRWALLDVAFRISVGVATGALLGWVLARLIFRFGLDEDAPLAIENLLVLTITLSAYGLTEVVNGYGFLGTFVAAYMVRDYERTHDIHDQLHHAADQLERLLMAVVLVLFGGALVAGLLDELTWTGALVALALVLVVRPAAGLIGLLGDGSGWFRRGIISFYGIRGLGSLYYLSHALNEGEFPQQAEIWAVVGATVLVSLVVHGVTATPVMRRFDRILEAEHPS